MTTVVVQQGGGGGQGMQQNTQQWTTGMFGCFEDCGGCIFAYLCFPCYVCKLASKLREHCCLFMLGQQNSEIAIMAMRTKVRTAYGIQGSICGDFCCAMYCPQLMACQMDRELDARGANIF